jgi:hypothetical protein
MTRRFSTTRSHGTERRVRASPKLLEFDVISDEEFAQSVSS